MRTLEEREDRLAAARFWSRVEIAIGTIAVALPPLFYFFGPSTLGGPMFREDPPSRLPIELVAYVAVVIGYVWMLRIRFTGPEDGAPSNWRSH